MLLSLQLWWFLSLKIMRLELHGFGIKSRATKIPSPNVYIFLFFRITTLAERHFAWCYFNLSVLYSFPSFDTWYSGKSGIGRIFIRWFILPKTGSLSHLEYAIGILPYRFRLYKHRYKIIFIALWKIEQHVPVAKYSISISEETSFRIGTCLYAPA